MVSVERGAAKRRRWQRVGAALVLLVLGLVSVQLVRQRDVGRWRLRSDLAKVESQRDLPYRKGSSHPKHRLDVYRLGSEPGRAVIHFVHGGYWTGGDKDHHRWLTGLYGSVGQAVALENFVGVVQSYRLAPEVDVAAMQSDVAAAVCWTKRNIARYGGDPRKIVVMGHSAGGHLVAMLATRKKDDCGGPPLLGYVTLSAIWDVADMHQSQDEAFHKEVSWPVFGRATERYGAFSPLARLKHVSGPVLVAVGSRDEPYLIPQARRAYRALQSQSEQHRFVEIAGASHRDMVLRWGSDDRSLTRTVVDFAAQLALKAK